MKLLTTDKEKKLVMKQLRPVSHFEKVVFPVLSCIVISLLLPPVAALIGMLMMGNLYQESGCMDRLSDTAQNSLMNIVTIMLATGTGLTMDAVSFLNYKTLLIICLGLVAFAFGTIGGVIFGKIMYMVDGVTNPLIGCRCIRSADGSSCISDCWSEIQSWSNFLLMHAMGPNVAGVIGTAVAAGTMLAMIGPAPVK
jgi:oxaloacetate decarboxylase beta subunit/glutaconyl-CoA decarboxylase